MKIGVIGLRGAWSTESLANQLKKKCAGGQIISPSEISYDLHQMKFYHEYHDLLSFDGFILKKMGDVYSPHLHDQLELLGLLEKKGLKIFSSPARIRTMISRLSCTVRLREHNIPMPPTFITDNVSDALKWIKENGRVVLKPLYSTKARGMLILDENNNPEQKIKSYMASGQPILYLQKMFDLSGVDYGLVFLGDEFKGAYARVSDGSSWNTSTRGGGQYHPYTPPDDIIELARKAQAPFGLDFTSVDVAITKEMGAIVFEVSAFGGYRGLYQACDIDASDLLTNYVIDRINNG